MSEKYQWYNNVKFTRDDDTGYYLNSTLRKRMHVYVWEQNYEKVPKGYEVHHKDFDRSNNDISNLQLLTVSEHKRLHGNLLTEEQREWRRNNINEKARPQAIEWHKSEEGRKWHKQQYLNTRDVLHKKLPYTCIQCGKEFLGEYGSKFCSNACKSAHRRKMGVDLVEKECIICGKKFMTDKNKKICTCSRTCGTILGHRRRDESKISKENRQDSTCI